MLYPGRRSRGELAWSLGVFFLPWRMAVVVVVVLVVAVELAVVSLSI